jgi:hypothetical protein
MERDIVAEAGRSKFGDARLSRRASLITRSLLENPGASLPKALLCGKAQEAAYRLLRNPRVTLEAVLAPHLAQTATLMNSYSGPVVVAHDTSEFCFAGEPRAGLGRLMHGRQGFLGHFALALAPGDSVARPIGLLGLSLVFRSGEPKRNRPSAESRDDPHSESKRWWKLVENCEEGLAADKIGPLHVMDREADIYDLLSKLVEHGCRFVVRASHNRRTQAGGHLFDELDEVGSDAPAHLRTVTISARQSGGSREKSHPSRASRKTVLRISARKVTLTRSKDMASSLPDTLAVNLIVVNEVDCPEGETPISWRLLTTEPVENEHHLAACVDAYKSRWLIEEFFKVLKTGCNYERKQLESTDTLLPMLGLYIPIACHLLAFRTLARSDEAELPATTLMTEGELEALRAADQGTLPSEPTIKDAVAAIARLGGHIKNNGAPGWLVLWRGYQDFLVFERGWRAARRRCDQ